VLAAADVLDGDAAPGVDRPNVDASARLEEILPLLARSDSGVAVTGAGGETIGIISTKSVIAALAAGS
jgi:predicted transcriptional regulator